MNDMVILGEVPVKQFLYDDLAELVLPSSMLLQANTDEVELPSDPRFQIAQKMDGFVKRFAQVCCQAGLNGLMLIPCSPLWILCDVRASIAVESGEPCVIR